MPAGATIFVFSKNLLGGLEGFWLFFSVCLKFYGINEGRFQCRPAPAQYLNLLF